MTRYYDPEYNREITLKEIEMQYESGSWYANLEEFKHTNFKECETKEDLEKWINA